MLILILLLTFYYLVFIRPLKKESNTYTNDESFEIDQMATTSSTISCCKKEGTKHLKFSLFGLNKKRVVLAPVRIVNTPSKPKTNSIPIHVNI